MRNGITIAFTVLMIGLAGTAQAAIITPTLVTATSSHSSYPIGATIDGSGLSGGGTSGDILSELHATSAANNCWLGDKDDNQVVDFTLAGAADVAAVHFWQYDRNSNGSWDRRTLSSFDIAFSTDNGTTYSTPIAITGIAGDDIAGSGSAIIPVQTFTFAQLTGVTNIQMTNLVNHGDNDWVAFSEIRFDTVPEPGTMALLALGGLAMIRRRRRG